MIRRKNVPASLTRAALLALVIGASGCYHATVRTGPAPLEASPTDPAPTVVQSAWSHSWLWGLIPPKPMDAQQRCGGAPTSVETQLSLMNQVVGFVTGGIYTPMNVRITCSAD